jgi:membrane protein DedA with SNARE-associated domain
MCGDCSGRPAREERQCHSKLATLISAHGYWIVVAAVALESMGIPVPGETALVTAAIFAGTTHRLNIEFVIAAAAIGAIVGDNIGYLLGRKFGYILLLRYGRLARIDASRIKLGQYVFARHGAKVVFFGRFVAVLRALAALLAGINYMGWRRFLFFNASGGIVWAAGYGFAAYVFGERLERLRGPVAVIGLVLAAAACVGGIWWMRRHEATLLAEAERTFPGPLPA